MQGLTDPTRNHHTEDEVIVRAAKKLKKAKKKRKKASEQKKKNKKKKKLKKVKKVEKLRETKSHGQQDSQAELTAIRISHRASP